MLIWLRFGESLVLVGKTIGNSLLYSVSGLWYNSVLKEIFMSMVKRLLEDYVAAKHPGDDEAQDKLFEAICDGTVQPTLEEMQAVIAAHEEIIEP